MAVSVYDWMVAQKVPAHAPMEGNTPGREDILVRILRTLDKETCKAHVASI